MALSSGCSFVIDPPKPEHCHEPPRQKIDEAQFREKVLTSVENNPTKKVKYIYDTELQASTSDYIPIYHTTRPSMIKLRTKLLPEIE